MPDMILATEIILAIICCFLSLICWIILFNIPKLKIFLLVLDSQINTLRQQILAIQLAIQQISWQKLIQATFFSPATLLAIIEMIALARQKALTKRAFLVLLFKR
jgi:hypothetical protein